MQYAYRKMHSPGEVLERDHMEVERDKLYEEQGVRTLEEEHRTIRGDRG